MSQQIEWVLFCACPGYNSTPVDDDGAVRYLDIVIIFLPG